MPSINFGIGPNGPVVIALIGNSTPRVQAMRAAGIEPPSAVQGTFLIDTGASSTCVDPALIQGLGLAPSGRVAIQTPSTGGNHHYCNQYDACLYIPDGKTGFLIHALPILETSLSAQGIDGLIGRDVIDRCTLVYNGSAKFATLAY